MDLGSRYRTPLSVETRASLRDIQPSISMHGRLGEVHVVNSVLQNMLLPLEHTVKRQTETERERDDRDTLTQKERDGDRHYFQARVVL